MQKTIFLFRHGEPSKGADCCKGKKLDCTLSEKGEEQTRLNVEYVLRRAQARARELLVVTSPLIRARRFGEMAAEHGIPYEVEEYWTDIDVGLWEGIPWSEIKRRWPDQYALVKSDGLKLQLPEGESVPAYVDRVIETFRQRLLTAERDLVFVGHSATNEAVLSYVEGRPHLDFGSQDIGCMNQIDCADDGTLTVRMKNQIRYHPHDAHA